MPIVFASYQIAYLCSQALPIMQSLHTVLIVKSKGPCAHSHGTHSRATVPKRRKRYFLWYVVKQQTGLYLHKVEFWSPAVSDQNFNPPLSSPKHSIGNSVWAREVPRWQPRLCLPFTTKHSGNQQICNLLSKMVTESIEYRQVGIFNSPQPI